MSTFSQELGLLKKYNLAEQKIENKNSTSSKYPIGPSQTTTYATRQHRNPVSLESDVHGRRESVNSVKSSKCMILRKICSCVYDCVCCCVFIILVGILGFLLALLRVFNQI